MITRRTTLAGLSATCLAGPGVSACAAQTDVVPGQARLLIHEGSVIRSEIKGHVAGRDFTLDSPFRVASISKVLTAELARRLHNAGALDKFADISDYLGYRVRHPEFSEEPISLHRLLCHQSGIIDPAVYWVAAPGSIRSILTDEIYERGVKPGAGFRYSNLNYGLAATVMEAATGRRFDQLFTDWVAKPLGLDIGFNWSRVSREKRDGGFPCMRRINSEWRVQVDDAAMLGQIGPVFLSDPDWSLSDYVPGTNGTLFSPQGGLRASVNDLAVIGRDVLLTQPALTTPLWRAESDLDPASFSEDTGGHPTEAGHFIAFGEGLYIYPDGPLGESSDSPPRLWFGHHGEAYGFYGGLWVAPKRAGIAESIFIHANLGSPETGYPMTGTVPNHTTIARRDFLWALSR